LTVPAQRRCLRCELYLRARMTDFHTRMDSTRGHRHRRPPLLRRLLLRHPARSVAIPSPKRTGQGPTSGGLVETPTSDRAAAFQTGRTGMA
jgi:hypothetical protein